MQFAFVCQALNVRLEHFCDLKCIDVNMLDVVCKLCRLAPCVQRHHLYIHVQ